MNHGSTRPGWRPRLPPVGTRRGFVKVSTLTCLWRCTVDQLVQWFEAFLNELPPFLQLIVGMFISLGIFKLLTVVVDAYQNRKTKDE